MDCLGHGTDRKRATWTLVRGRIGPATERFENGSCGRRFAEGKSWYPGGPEGNHVDAGSAKSHLGNEAIWKRTRRTPVHGRTGLGGGTVWRRMTRTPGARKNRLGNRTVRKRAKWTQVRGRIVRPSGGPEARHADAGSPMKCPGNGAIRQGSHADEGAARTRHGDGAVWRRITRTCGARKNRPGNGKIWKRAKWTKVRGRIDQATREAGNELSALRSGTVSLGGVS